MSVIDREGWVTCHFKTVWTFSLTKKYSTEMKNLWVLLECNISVLRKRQERKRKKKKKQNKTRQPIALTMDSCEDKSVFALLANVKENSCVGWHGCTLFCRRVRGASRGGNAPSRSLYRSSPRFWWCISSASTTRVCSAPNCQPTSTFRSTTLTCRLMLLNEVRVYLFCCLLWWLRLL